MVKHIWNSEHLFKTFDTVSVHETAVHIIGIHDIKSLYLGTNFCVEVFPVL